MERSSTGRARPPQAFVEMVQAAMDRQEMSRKDLADHLGLSLRYVQKAVTGAERPNRERVVEIARILQIPADSLMWAAGYVPEDMHEALFAVPVKKIRKLAGVAS